MGGFVIDHLAETLFASPAVKPQTLESMLKKHAAGGSFFKPFILDLIAECYCKVGMHAKNNWKKNSRVKIRKNLSKLVLFKHQEMRFYLSITCYS